MLHYITEYTYIMDKNILHTSQKLSFCLAIAFNPTSVLLLQFK